MTGPDFMLIGAMKCGTSTLQAQLACQQGVFMTTPKEPNFFSDDDIYAQGIDWYLQLYADAAPGDLRGEASTHYTKQPTYPQTLSRMQADLRKPLKLIYMIRNPVQRAVSHYIHEWTMSNMGQDVEAEFSRHTEMIDYGRYAMQLAPFIDAYGLENIHLTSLEQVKADPDGEFAKVVRFLNLPEGATWVHELEAQNVSAERMRKIPLQGLLIDNPVAKALRQVLIPKSIRTKIRQTRTMQTRPEISQTLQRRMEQSFLDDRATLARFFPGHAALTLCYPFADA